MKTKIFSTVRLSVSGQEHQKTNYKAVIKSIIKTTIAIFVIATTILSCAKDDDVAPVGGIPSKPYNYRLIKDEYSSYVYNALGKLSSIKKGLDFSNYSYDADGKPISIEKEGNLKISFFYNINGTISERIEYLNGVALAKKTYDYDGFSNNLNVIKNYFWNGTAFVVNGAAGAILNYNNAGKLKKFWNSLLSNPNEYEDFSYDTNGNMISHKTYRLKTGSSTIYYLNSEKKYTYDDKKNPLYKLNPLLLPTDDITLTNYLDSEAPHNQTSGIYDFYNSDGTLSSTSNGIYNYEYNELGYPTKKTSLGSNIIFKYEIY